GRAALFDVARAVAERGDGDEGVAPPVRELRLFERVLPHDRHLQLLGELLVRLPRFRLARSADDEAEVREICKPREGTHQRFDPLPRLRGTKIENVIAVAAIIEIRPIWNHTNLLARNTQPRQAPCRRLR